MSDAIGRTHHPATQVLADEPKGKLRALVNRQSVLFGRIEEKFAARAELWDEHNSGRSMVDHSHFAHLQIIGMGPPALPLLLDRLVEGDGRWVFALKSISGDQTDTPLTRGDLDAVIDGWTDWGKRNGHI